MPTKWLSQIYKFVNKIKLLGIVQKLWKVTLWLRFPTPPGPRSSQLYAFSRYFRINNTLYIGDKKLFCCTHECGGFETVSGSRMGQNTSEPLPYRGGRIPKKTWYGYWCEGRPYWKMTLFDSYVYFLLYCIFFCYLSLFWIINKAKKVHGLSVHTSLSQCAETLGIHRITNFSALLLLFCMSCLYS